MQDPASWVWMDVEWQKPSSLDSFVCLAGCRDLAAECPVVLHTWTKRSLPTTIRKTTAMKCLSLSAQEQPISRWNLMRDVKLKKGTARLLFSPWAVDQKMRREVIEVVLSQVWLSRIYRRQRWENTLWHESWHWQVAQGGLLFPETHRRPTPAAVLLLQPQGITEIMVLDGSTYITLLWKGSVTYQSSAPVLWLMFLRNLAMAICLFVCSCIGMVGGAVESPNRDLWPRKSNNLLSGSS